MEIREQSFAVNGVIVDLGGETLRTETGDAVALRPQAFSVLRYMAEHAGRLVTKDELMNAVWPGLIVTDDSLVQCVHEIRRALQDDGRVVLKTAPKRGYLLVLPATPAPSAEPAGNGVETAKVHICVLPFANMSSDTDQHHLANGITEDIVTDLSRWRTITVSSRHRLRLNGEPVDVRAAARELGVTFLVEGSVRRLEDHVRITAQLVDARTGHHVWAERYDRPLRDFPARQDEVVRQIVGTLVGRVYVNEAEHLRRRPPTHPAAGDLTMRANWLTWDHPAARAEAKRCLEQAIELDPDYGLAHSLLALVLHREWHRGCSKSPELLDQGFALAKRAVELADTDSTSHVALAFQYLERRSFAQALSHMEHAVAINPANPALKADFGIFLTRVGRAEEALQWLRSARSADPFFGPAWFWQQLGFAQLMLRRYADALADFEREAPKNADTLAMMAGCCAKLGVMERANRLVTECLEVQPEATLHDLVERTPLAQAADSEHFAECLRLAGMPE